MDATLSEEPDTVILRTEVSMARIRLVMPVRVKRMREEVVHANWNCEHSFEGHLFTI
jgi:hypothetical protein